MTELEGDPVKPSVLIIPSIAGVADGATAEIKYSGAKLWVYTTSWEIITST
ncbi:hypothetical protein LCGC14_2631800 [marine sediment metagenome]|uniref:Uncharacterized protein n=1 Tax=marine sediment metagenome TaxID=412755 RepID=A0A0F8ZZW9_9ZZZZ